MTAVGKQDVEQMNRAVDWPAVIHYSGDDELVFIKEFSELEEAGNLIAVAQAAADRLIDSQGQVFTLVVQNSQRLVPQAVNETLNAQQLTELVRKHFAVSGACCVSKIHAASIADCMTLLRHELEI